MKQKFDITGMSCSSCSSYLEKCINELKGINTASVQLLANSMQVEYDTSLLGENDIIQAVEKAGYHGKPAEDAFKEEQRSSTTVTPLKSPEEEEMEEKKKRLWVSVICLVPLMYISMFHMFYEWFSLPIPAIVMKYFHGNANAITFSFTQFLLLLPIIYVNRVFFTSGFKMLVKRHPNMDSLIAIGSGAAIVYGIFVIFRIGYGLGIGDMALVEQYAMDIYFESAGTILTLITLGKYLESKSKKKTSESIRKLMDLAPKTALVERENQVLELPIEEVQVGDILHVKPGSKVPVDGVIIEGKAGIDESAITGESIPVEKTVGSHVIAATLNKTGFFKCKATKIGKDTTFMQIIQLVEEASSSKAPIAKLADKISGIFVPTIIGIAILCFFGWIIAGATFEFAMSIGIAVLVISCPCALGLATPVAIMVGTGEGAKQGILIKSGDALQKAQSITTVVFDKTGTLTTGETIVTEVESFQKNVEIQRILQVASCIESASEHPLAEAIVKEAQKYEKENLQIQEFETVFGKGVKALVNEKQYYLGNIALMDENLIPITKEQQLAMNQVASQGKTPLLLADDSGALGLISVADTLKKDSAEAIRQFHKLKISTVMLTGDNEITAMAIQKELQLDAVFAQMLPENKEKKIRELREQGECVAMIGDGINDAPALASADVGIAIGAGTDVAMESADMVLMKNDLRDAVTAIALSKAVLRNIKQNLFWAFFYNCIGIPIAAGIFYPAFGFKLNPMFGAAAMSLSSLFVVGNALRLKWKKY